MEKFDLYDINRNFTGKIINRGDEVPSGYYRAVVHLIIFNSKGEMLIQQRSDNKKNWPSKWDISVGGCVISGENSLQAMIRESKEELGLDLENVLNRPVFTFNFSEGFDDIYLLNMDVELNEIILQEEEVQAVKWETIDNILKMIKNDEFILYHDSFIKLMYETRLSTDIYKE